MFRGNITRKKKYTLENFGNVLEILGTYSYYSEKFRRNIKTAYRKIFRKFFIKKKFLRF